MATTWPARLDADDDRVITQAEMAPLTRRDFRDRAEKIKEWTLIAGILLLVSAGALIARESVFRTGAADNLYARLASFVAVGAMIGGLALLGMAAERAAKCVEKDIFTKVTAASACGGAALVVWVAAAATGTGVAASADVQWGQKMPLATGSTIVLLITAGALALVVNAVEVDDYTAKIDADCLLQPPVAPSAGPSAGPAGPPPPTTVDSSSAPAPAPTA